MRKGRSRRCRRGLLGPRSRQRSSGGYCGAVAQCFSGFKRRFIEVLVEWVVHSSWLVLISDVPKHREDGAVLVEGKSRSRLTH